MKKTNKIISERETRVLLENMYSDINKIAEGQSLTDSRLSGLEKTVFELIEVKPEIKTISMAVMELSSDVKAIDTRLSAVDSRLNAVDTRLKVVEKKLDENLDRHEKRIAKLENKVFA